MIRTKLTTVGGESYYVYRPSVTAEWISGNNQSGMPIENTLFFDTRGQRLVSKVYPIHHAKLHGCLIGQRIRSKFWWMRHSYLQIYLFTIGVHMLQKGALAFHWTQVENGNRLV
jgi:hypothetical protein